MLLQGAFKPTKSCFSEPMFWLQILTFLTPEDFTSQHSKPKHCTHNPFKAKFKPAHLKVIGASIPSAPCQKAALLCQLERLVGMMELVPGRAELWPASH